MSAEIDVCLNCLRTGCLLDSSDGCYLLLNSKRDPEEVRRKARERYYVKRDAPTVEERKAKLAYLRDHYQKNKDKISARNRDNYEKNGKEIAAYQRDYYQNNRERITARRKRKKAEAAK